jgi:hypothetical protein
LNLGSANVVVRPRSTSESLDLSFPFMLRVGGRRYLTLVALVLAPAFLCCIALKLWLSLSWAEMWLLALPLGLWLQGPFTLAAGELMFDEQIQPARTLSNFVRRLPSYTALFVFTRGMIALSSLTVLLVPLAWSRYAFAPEASLLEALPFKRAGERAARLGHGASNFELSLWSLALIAFGVLAAENLGLAIFGYVLQLPLPAGDLLSEGGSAYALFGWFASIPVAATLRFLRYVDRRTRSDGWDVQIRLQHVAQLAGEAR